MSAEPPRRRWARAYMRLRRAEGRGEGGEAELLALPFHDIDRIVQHALDQKIA